MDRKKDGKVTVFPPTIVFPDWDEKF
jgi:hypothetical protein